MKDKKSTIIICVVLAALLLVAVGISYAYWYLTKTQTGKNVIETGCLNLSLTNEQNNINLEGAMPISDEDGAKLTPYTFTVTNTCDNTEYYQVNLETLADTTLNEKYVRVIFDDEEANDLNVYPTAEKYIETSKGSRTLAVGSLAKNQSKNYSLRVFLSGENAVDEDSMNKRFESKIIINGSLNEFNAVVMSTTSNVLYGFENDYEEPLYVPDYHFFVDNGAYAFIRKTGAKKEVCLYYSDELHCFGEVTDELIENTVETYTCYQASFTKYCNPVEGNYDYAYTILTAYTHPDLSFGVSGGETNCRLYENGDVSCFYDIDILKEYQYWIWEGKTVYYNINGSNAEYSKDYMDLVNKDITAFIKEKKTSREVCLYKNNDIECYSLTEDLLSSLYTKYECSVDQYETHTCMIDEDNNEFISASIINPKEINISSGYNTCILYEDGYYCNH